jgi:hypothetical protein
MVLPFFEMTDKSKFNHLGRQVHQENQKYFEMNNIFGGQILDSCQFLISWVPWIVKIFR